MLKRRSIRTKLIVALTLLSAIVLLLASSGIWGLYRYRQLANAVSQRARELPYASKLNRLAITLKDSFNRTNEANELRDREGMIHSSRLGDPLIDIQDLERDRFEEALFAFGLTLQLYQDAVTANAEQETVLVDHVLQQRSLRDIGQSLESLRAILDKRRPLDINRRAELESRIDELVRRTDEHIGTIQSRMEDFSDEVHGQYSAWITMAWSCTILAFCMVGILLWAFRSLVVKPFRTLLDGSRLVAGGQFDHRIDLGTGDELSELAGAMNDMTDRFQGALRTVNSYCTDLDRQVRERTRELIQNEHLASVGFLAAGVAHEINNPLATVAWSAESLQSRVAEIGMLESSERLVNNELLGELTTSLRRIEDEAYRCKGITEKLLDFSRLSDVRRAPTDLVDLVAEVVTMVGQVGKYRCKTIRTHASDPVVAQVNPQEIRQVVLNLVTNALESVDCDGAVDVRVCTLGTCASVVVEDNGCGMTDEVLRHLFEPFFTRRRDGSGTGLGLSITYRIVSQHGGSLTAASEGEGHGSRMEMLLPLTTDSNDSTTSHHTLGLNHEPYQTVK